MSRWNVLVEMFGLECECLFLRTLKKKSSDD